MSWASGSLTLFGIDAVHAVPCVTAAKNVSFETWCASGSTLYVFLKQIMIFDKLK
jgi:hypothetical protein